MIKKMFLMSATAIAAIAAAASANAANVAIVKGSFYTTNLKTALEAKGHTVTEINNYTAASLAGFNTVIQYGNMFVDQSALSTFVNGGGRLIWTPWAGHNFNVNADLQIFDNGGGDIYSMANPGVNVLSADALLTGVTFPAAGSPNIGRTDGIDFVGGVSQVADWSDGVALLGYKTVGSGLVIGLNMHVITSDTAYQVVDTTWGGQLMSNLVGAGSPAVPEPATWGMMIAGFAVVGSAMRRRATKVSFA